ncbi:hypothetical protein V1634_05905 [Plantactinospora veratri]|uniref:Uncharacterized protein n=1 Tax=Plantactinospora veratri TaxID=1436122 RepID=A0ABU7S8U5_9ACTN
MFILLNGVRGPSGHPASALTDTRKKVILKPRPVSSVEEGPMPPNGRSQQEKVVTGDMTSAIEDVTENGAGASPENEQKEPRQRVRVLQYSRSDLLI